jgi:ALG6, ALG8 glycosyltransferase family
VQVIFSSNGEISILPRSSKNSGINHLQRLRITWTDDSMAATMVTISPALVYTWLHPNPKRLPEVFTLTALGFFLCSFQVHEKSILLPLSPASVLLFSPDPIDRQWTIWINTISTISYPILLQSYFSNTKNSLWPLLKKDGLALQYFIFLPLWLFLSYEPTPLTLSKIIHLVPPCQGHALMRFRWRDWLRDIY